MEINGGTIVSEMNVVNMGQRMEQASNLPLPSDLVWYAAYDQDATKDIFKERMGKWVPSFEIT